LFFENFEIDDEDKVFVIAEEIPEFSNGYTALVKWISKTVIYSMIAK